MKKNKILPALLSALLLALLCTACGKKGEDLPPPDLNGVWLQPGWENSSYYQFGIVRDGELLIYWLTPSDKSRDLYWAGTYVPPENGAEPYKWTSESRRSEHREANRFTLVDESKIFLYQKGQIVYDVMMGHMKMGMALSRLEDLDADPGEAGIPAWMLPETAPAPSPAPQAPAQNAEPVPEEWAPPPAPPNQLQ